MNKEALPGGLVLIKPIGSKMEPYTTADELAEVTKREAQVCALLDCGMNYEAIRDIVRPRENY